MPSASRVPRPLLVLAGLLAGVLCLFACEPEKPRRAPAAHGTVQELTDADTILVSDLAGSLLVETSGTGKPRGRFATYPFGATRVDTAVATEKYAAVPRDGVTLDAMGARFYAPDLGVWTSGDPLALTSPERLVTADFAAANPYAYAKDSPLLVADRDGHFWHIALGSALGALMGGSMEAGRQYLATGRVEDWGRVAAAATGGAVSGALFAAVPATALGSVMTMGAVSGAADGVTTRLVASGGQSAGTATELLTDAAVGAATAGVLKGGAALVRGAPTAVRTLLDSAKAKLKPKINNPIPKTLVRVIPGEKVFPTLGPEENPDVFVTAAEDIAGLNPAQIAERLGIEPSPVYTLIHFKTPNEGLASPILRSNPKFIGRGVTSGGAREFVLPNGPVPSNAVTSVVRK